MGQISFSFFFQVLVWSWSAQGLLLVHFLSILIPRLLLLVTALIPSPLRMPYYAAYLLLYAESNSKRRLNRTVITG